MGTEHTAEQSRTIGQELVADALKHLEMTLAPHRFEEAKTVSGRATKLLNEVHKHSPQEFIHVHPIALREKAYLSFGLAATLGNQPVQTLSEAEQAQLYDLFPNSRELGDISRFFLAAMRLTWPDIDSSNGLRSFRAKAQDGLIEIPRGVLTADICKAMGISDRLQIKSVGEFYDKFKGGTDPNQRIGFVWADIPERDKSHERLHLKYPGLRSGNFGHSLNEGITEWLNRTSLNHGQVGIITDEDVYWRELLLLQELYRKYPFLQAPLEKRYRLFSEDSVDSLHSVLINTVGIYTHYLLYRAHHALRNVTKADKYTTDDVRYALYSNK